MIIFIVIISFILDSIVSNLVSINGIMMPLFTIMSLIIIYPYFNNNKNKFYPTCFFLGMAYDLIYTNTIIFHACLFLLLGFIVSKLNLVLSNNYINVAIMGIIIIIIYRLITYFLLLITAAVSFNIWNLFESIYSSLIINVIFVILAYIITDKISYKLKIHKAN